MKKQDLDFIDKIVCKYLAHDEARARRIIKRALPKLHVAERPRLRPSGKKGKANGTNLIRQAG